MNRYLTAALLLLAALSFTDPLHANQEQEPESRWSGVDETVVEKFAEAAGRPARDPYINVGEGDMLLFCFLMAGTIGGFIGGYYFRILFGEKRESSE